MLALSEEKQKGEGMNRFIKSILLFGICIAIVGTAAGLFLDGALASPADENEKETAQQAPASEHTNWRDVFLALSAALVTASGCFGAAYAVGRVGAAALGAASEKPELLGRSLLFVGLAEGIAIYGLIVGIMLLMKIV